MTHTLPFCDPPSSNDRGPSFSIVRCNKAERYQVPFYCLSDNVFGFNVHYIGRSVLCNKALGECEFCKENRAIRWVGYLAATNETRQKLFLVEITAGVMPDIRRYRKTWTSLRGHFVTLSRPSMRPTGKLSIDFAGHGKFLPDATCPKSFNVPSALARIYGLTKMELPGENVPIHHSQTLNTLLRDSNSAPTVAIDPESESPMEQLEQQLRGRGNGHLSAS